MFLINIYCLKVLYHLNCVTEIHFSNLFLGFGAGAFTLAVPAYVSEIAERSIQGALGSCMQLSMTIGILFVSGLAIGEVKNAIDWNIITGVCIAFPGAF